MKDNYQKALTHGGAIAAGAALGKLTLSKMPSPIVALAALAGGAYLYASGKGNPAIATGVMTAGVMGTLSHAAVQAKLPFLKGLDGNGLNGVNGGVGQIIFDAQGNPYHVSGINGAMAGGAQLVQDQYGNSYYTVGGLAGENDFDDFEDLSGTEAEIDKLLGITAGMEGDYDAYEDLDGFYGDYEDDLMADLEGLNGEDEAIMNMM
ncbi:hypothetical protein V6R21_24905 [Limibacter armeniacum]|uniref:hypothetical protein n=1 Tax=Limibacter armeniacum TaxID=466084 RepID=UPI002FE61D08